MPTSWTRGSERCAITAEFILLGGTLHAQHDFHTASTHDLGCMPLRSPRQLRTPYRCHAKWVQMGKGASWPRLCRSYVQAFSGIIRLPCGIIFSESSTTILIAQYMRESDAAQQCCRRLSQPTIPASGWIVLNCANTPQGHCQRLFSYCDRNKLSTDLLRASLVRSVCRQMTAWK